MLHQKTIHSDSQDKLTVRKHSFTLGFPIYHNQDLILNVLIGNDALVSDLLQIVRKKLSHRFENIIGLCSANELQIVDYTLTIPNYPISNYRNHEPFKLLFEDVVHDENTPTLADFTFLKCIGGGVSSQVYLVRHNCNGLLYALKQIKKEYFQDFKRLQQVLREKKIMTDIVSNMPFAVKLYCSFQSCYDLNFLLQFYPGGELFYHLQQARFTEDQARLYFAEILVTFEVLHSCNTIYRDLKPENIMVDFQGHLRLGDFGLCKINLMQSDLTYSYCGSPQYMAPQTKLQSGYSYPVDFFAMGALIYEMVLGVPPQYKGNPLEFPAGLSQDFKEIVMKLIDKNPKKRVSSYAQLRSMRWLQKIDWTKIDKKQYKMPIKITPYSNYTHEQFKSVAVDNKALKKQVKYDRLFNMFFHISDHQGGIKMNYNGRDQFQMQKQKIQKIKTIKIKQKEKDKSNMKSPKNNSETSQHTRSQFKAKPRKSISNSHSVSRNSKGKQLIQPLQIKRKTTKRDTIYTGNYPQTSTRPDYQSTTKSRIKLHTSRILTNKNKMANSPSIKFSKLVKAKSQKMLVPQPKIQKNSRNTNHNQSKTSARNPHPVNSQQSSTRTSQDQMLASSLHINPQGSQLCSNQVYGNYVQAPQPPRIQTQDHEPNKVRQNAFSYHLNSKKL